MYEKGREKWENLRNRWIKSMSATSGSFDTAFRLFVEKKIEAVSMDEVAKEAGVGRATLFRCYNNKTELAIAVCASKWKAYLDKLDEARPISSIHEYSGFFKSVRFYILRWTVLYYRGHVQ